MNPTVEEAQDFALDCYNAIKGLKEWQDKTSGFRFEMTVAQCRRREWLLSLPDRSIKEDNELNELDWKYRVKVNDKFQLYEGTWGDCL